MAAPTCTAYYGAPVVAGVMKSGMSWQAGDRIDGFIFTEDSAVTVTSVPTASDGSTFTLGTAIASASSCYGRSFTCLSAATTTAVGTISASYAGIKHGYIVAVVSRAGTFGGVTIFAPGTSTAPTLSLTFAGPNSFGLFGGADWGAAATTGHTSMTPAGTQGIATVDGTVMTCYGGEWSNQSANTGSYGLAGSALAANLTKYALEVTGTGGGAAAIPALPVVPLGAVMRSSRG